MVTIQISARPLADCVRPTCHIVRFGSCSRLILVREVGVSRDVPQNKQMSNKK